MASTHEGYRRAIDVPLVCATDILYAIGPDSGGEHGIGKSARRRRFEAAVAGRRRADRREVKHARTYPKMTVSSREEGGLITFGIGGLWSVKVFASVARSKIKLL